MSKKPSLLETHPEVAREAHGWDPQAVTHGSRKKLAWKCKLGHIWEAQPNDRTGAKSGCPVCANRKLLVGFNDLATTHPALAAQAHGWDPSAVMAGSSVNLEWICEKGHIWLSIPVSRVRQETGCLVCLGKQVEKGFNDLATTHPEIAAQANGWDPAQVSAGSNKKLSWKCNLGHVWNAQPNGRAGAKSGCPVCVNAKVEIGFNDLATTHPEIATQAHGWDPRTVVAGSNSTRTWLCEFGHTWKSQVTSRISQNTGCLVCINKQIQVGFNDLATTHPEIAKEADGWDPTTVVFGSEKKLLWRCNLGHSYKSTPKSRTTANTACPICSGNQVLQGFNDLKTTHPELALQAVGWNPEEFISGSHSKKRWRCDDGHEWTAEIKSRALSGRNCPSCAQSGFDPNKDGWLYFLQHTDWEMLQIGITNVPDDRLATHRKLGWEMLELRGPMNGDLARQWETDILKMLKSKKAVIGNAEIAGKFTGYTESWMKKSFPISSLKELMQLVRENEETE